MTEADQGWAAPSLADPTPAMGALGIIRLGKAPVTLHLRGSKQRHHNRGPQGGAGICMRQVRIELTTLGLWDLRAASCATATHDMQSLFCYQRPGHRICPASTLHSHFRWSCVHSPHKVHGSLVATPPAKTLKVASSILAGRGANRYTRAAPGSRSGAAPGTRHLLCSSPCTFTTDDPICRSSSRPARGRVATTST